MVSRDCKTGTYIVIRKGIDNIIGEKVFSSLDIICKCTSVHIIGHNECECFNSF